MLATLVLVVCLVQNGTVVAADGPLSTEEVSDIAAMADAKGITFEDAVTQYRYRLQAAPVIDAVYARPDMFAGAFQDDSGGSWRLRIEYADDAGLTDPDVQKSLPVGLPIQWDKVRHSYAELQIVRDEIVNYWRSIGLDGLNSVSIHAPDNRVVVSLPTRDEEISRWVSERFGDEVAVPYESPDVPVTCNSTNDPEGGSRYHCSPYRGAIEVQTQSGNHDGHCTSTLWAKLVGWPNTRYLVTAGHCGNQGSTQNFFHAGSFMGASAWSQDTLGFSTPRSDARLIAATPNTTQMNRVYETPSTKSYALTGSRSWAQQQVNDWVCKLGTGTGENSPVPTFGRQCGPIINADTTFAMGGHVLPAKQADFNGTCWFSCDGYGVSGGDSGASVVYAGQLNGLAATLQGKYSISDDIEDDLGIAFCMTVSC